MTCYTKKLMTLSVGLLSTYVVLVSFSLGQSSETQDRHVTGELRFVDVQKKAVVVQAGKLTVGAEVDENTNIEIRGKKAGLGDLKVGEKVDLNYRRNGRLIARSIVVGRDKLANKNVED